ncbi:MAG: VOC family protein [Candidatus Krumholzibacteria bacterium]|nr:VOC family protein [Candidatus Krumholzibacteria bacterium]MDH5270633.1 VOC family protein [Candidatus Krumholzibacteria bacterium]
MDIANDPSEFRLATSASVGYVHLRVSDLDRSLAFYLDVLGLRMVSGGPSTATLSANGRGPGLIVLTEKKDAPPREPHSTGLYHVAIRVPSRRSLAMVIRHLGDVKWRIDGFADHDVSEAVYLADPDGNGLEVYADRPAELWPFRNGQVEMITVPLDLDSVLAELSDWPGDWGGIDSAARIGHVHLRVSDLARTEAFYHAVLGMSVTQRSIEGALFLAAGGYHHHVGANVWSSSGGPRPPADALGLISYSILLPDAASLDLLAARLAAAAAPARSQDSGRIRTADPDGNFVELVIA